MYPIAYYDFVPRLPLILYDSNSALYIQLGLSRTLLLASTVLERVLKRAWCVGYLRLG